MGKAKDIREAAKTWAHEARRDWHETPPQKTKDVRKLEGTWDRNKK